MPPNLNVYFEKINSSHKEIQIHSVGSESDSGYDLIQVEGVIDTYNSMDFTHAIVSMMQPMKGCTIVFDLSKLSYTSSTGIGSLIELSKRTKEYNIKMFLYRVSEKVSEVISMLGFTSFFNYIENLSEIKNAEIKQSFSAEQKCVYCNAKLKVQKSGRFKCSSCGNVFSVDAHGIISKE